MGNKRQVWALKMSILALERRLWALRRVGYMLQITLWTLETRGTSWFRRELALVPSNCPILCIFDKERIPILQICFCSLQAESML